MVQDIVPFEFFDVPRNYAWPPTSQGPKIQHGRRTHGKAIPTFFLWEITQKFFFLARGYHILATQKNNFCHPGGSQWGPGGHLAHFWGKKGYFRTNFHKNQGLLAFKTFLSPVGHENIVYIHRKAFFKIILGIKMYKKGFQKLRKLKFLTKKVSFSTKNTHKIENNCPRHLKLGLK